MVRLTFSNLKLRWKDQKLKNPDFSEAYREIGLIVEDPEISSLMLEENRTLGEIKLENVKTIRNVLHGDLSQRDNSWKKIYGSLDFY
jgi:hypothetical protein